MRAWGTAASTLIRPGVYKRHVAREAKICAVALNICGLSVWNLFDVIHPAPGIL
jgi:hypothetical protein